MYVIFKDLSGYCVTTQENYNAFIRDAHKVYKMYDFENASQIIEYWVQYFGTSEKDFFVVGDEQ